MSRDVADARRRCFSTLEPRGGLSALKFAQHRLCCRHRGAPLRPHEPHDRGQEDADEAGGLRRLGVVALAALGMLGLLLALRQGARDEEAEYGGPDQRGRRRELLHGAASGLFRMPDQLRATQGNALLDFVDFPVGRDHWGFCGASPRNWRSNAVKGISLMRASVHQPSTPAPTTLRTAATMSAVTQDAPCPSMNTTPAATRAIHVVTTSTAAMSTAPSSQASRIAARRASSTASSA